MRVFFRWMGVTLIVLAGWGAAPPLAQAANQDSIADRVVGQPNFSSIGAGLSATALTGPQGAVLDAHGDLFVADYGNDRVLEYLAPLSTGMAASRVFGQPSFLVDQAGLNASTLSQPVGVAVDAQGDLYVADHGNSRVLEYLAPLSSGMAASLVLGQADFTHNTANHNGVTATSLNLPEGVALDGAGNVYVADNANNRVLEYEVPLSSGMAASRVFGQPDFTHNDLNNGGVSFHPIASSLASPDGVAVDALGNLYVADYGNNRVLKYNAPLSTGMAASRVLGQLNFSSDGGGLDANSLSAPASVALDAAGNLYVADTANSRAVEYDAPLSNDQAAARVFGQPDFTHSTPSAGASGLHFPNGVALDAAGNLYVSDTSSSRVLEYDVPVPYAPPALTAIAPDTVAGGGPDFVLTVNGSNFVAGSVVRWAGSDRATTFVNSTQLTAAISSGDVAGGGPYAVTVFTPSPGGGSSSLRSLTLGSRAGHDSTADVEQGQPNFTGHNPNNALLPPASRLFWPAGLAVNPRTQRLFVADPINNRVLSWSAVPYFANGQPADLVLGQPNLLANSANDGGLTARGLSLPNGLALDAQGDLFVADTLNNRVLEYLAPLTTGMAASRVFGQGGSFTSGDANNGGTSANSLNAPQGVALDAQGNLYVADTGNNRVLEYAAPLSNGLAASRVFGQQGSFDSGLADHGGSVDAQGLSGPNAAALDGAGNLWVADGFNHRVLEYAAPFDGSAGAARVLGQSDFASHTPNPSGISASSLDFPAALAFDAAGNLYVADNGNNRVLQYSAPLSSGQAASGVYGQSGSFTSGAPNFGSINGRSLFGPQGLALDGQNNLYIADYYNSRVLEFDWALYRLALPLALR